MSEKLFRFTVENDRTGEKASFYGQGETMLQALGEGVKNANGTFRPNSDGKKTPGKMIPMKLAVTTRDGRKVNRSLPEFEGDEPFRE